MFNKFLPLGILICLILVGCNGAGSGNTPPPPKGNYGATIFNESSVTLTVGDIKKFTLLLPNYTTSLEGHNVDFWTYESGIVSFPLTCQLNGAVPPSCDIEVTAIESGTTSIVGYANTGPAVPLDITVINP